MAFDARTKADFDRWCTALQAAMRRTRRRAQLSLLLHTIELPQGAPALSLCAVPGELIVESDGNASPRLSEAPARQRLLLWCATDRPGAVHWIDALRGVIVRTLSRADMLRDAPAHSDGAQQAAPPPCSGKSLLVNTGDRTSSVLDPSDTAVWLAAPDCSILLCNARTGVCRSRLRGHSGVVEAMIDIHGVEVWSGSRDASIRVWRAVDGQPLAALECDRAVNALVHCGRVVWSGGADASFTLWSIASREPLLHLPPRNSDVLSVAIAVGARSVWNGSWDGSVTLWTGPKHDWQWKPMAATSADIPLLDRESLGDMNVPLEQRAPSIVERFGTAARAKRALLGASSGARGSGVLDVSDDAVRTSAAHERLHVRPRRSSTSGQRQALRRVPRQRNVFSLETALSSSDSTAAAAPLQRHVSAMPASSGAEHALAKSEAPLRRHVSALPATATAASYVDNDDAGADGVEKSGSDDVAASHDAASAPDGARPASELGRPTTVMERMSASESGETTMRGWWAEMDHAQSQGSTTQEASSHDASGASPQADGGDSLLEQIELIERSMSGRSSQRLRSGADDAVLSASAVRLSYRNTSASSSSSSRSRVAAALAASDGRESAGSERSVGEYAQLVDDETAAAAVGAATTTTSVRPATRSSTTLVALEADEADGDGDLSTSMSSLPPLPSVPQQVDSDGADSNGLQLDSNGLQADRNGLQASAAANRGWQAEAHEANNASGWQALDSSTNAAFASSAAPTLMPQAPSPFRKRK